ncbi:class I SAM-dependent methyltransferase [Halorubrum sp. F4]|uniref:class I SAM-dependent methyltransferase n=1 Tax=Halorubrum sp. F4 TaxID=2989715 RepID=UPI0024801796|nr:class I SAM-dependent methyltransferase [Halorubrum sp. F4]
MAKHTYQSAWTVYESAYYTVYPGKQRPAALHSSFVDSCFDSTNEYQSYRDEFFNGPAKEYLEEARREYDRLGGDGQFGGTDLDTGAALYALVRKYQPETIVETGVCNGCSTLFLLLALHENQTGQLYSIDYPFYADESLAEFKSETFDGYGGAAIPSDRDPGWIIPDDLRTRWTLRLGKAQEELPRLLDELPPVEFFIHDSEHSAPCMMMEFELAWTHLAEGGWILSDDIDWNDAWRIFTQVREPHQVGQIEPSMGYLRTSLKQH